MSSALLEGKAEELDGGWTHAIASRLAGEPGWFLQHNPLVSFPEDFKIDFAGTTTTTSSGLTCREAAETGTLLTMTDVRKGVAARHVGEMACSLEAMATSRRRDSAGRKPRVSIAPA